VSRSDSLIATASSEKRVLDKKLEKEDIVIINMIHLVKSYSLIPLPGCLRFYFCIIHVRLYHLSPVKCIEQSLLSDFPGCEIDTFCLLILTPQFTVPALFLPSFHSYRQITVIKKHDIL